MIKLAEILEIKNLGKLDPQIVSDYFFLLFNNSYGQISKEDIFTLLKKYGYSWKHSISVKKFMESLDKDNHSQLRSLYIELKELAKFGKLDEILNQGKITTKMASDLYKELYDSEKIEDPEEVMNILINYGDYTNYLEYYRKPDQVVDYWKWISEKGLLNRVYVELLKLKNKY